MTAANCKIALQVMPITVSVDQHLFTDRAGNPSSAGAAFVLQSDTTQPSITATISSDNTVTRGVTAASAVLDNHVQYTYDEPRWANAGDVITMDLVASEEVSMPRVFIAGRELERCVDDGSDPCGSPTCSDPNQNTEQSCTDNGGVWANSWKVTVGDNCGATSSGRCTTFVAVYLVHSGSQEDNEGIPIVIKDYADMTAGKPGSDVLYSACSDSQYTTEATHEELAALTNKCTAPAFGIL